MQTRIPEDTYDVDPIYNLTTLAKICDVPRPSIYDLINRHRVSTVVLGKRRGVRRSDVIKLLARLPVIDRGGDESDA